MIGWLTKRFRASRGGPEDDFWYSPLAAAMATAAGIHVTADNARQVPIVRDCQKTLSEPIASLPLIIYRRNEDGSKTRVDNHPLFDVLHNQPNAEQTAFEFRGTMQWWLAWYGNAYAEIKPGPRGAVDQLVPIHPNLVEPYRRDDGSIWYRVSDRPGTVRELRSDEIWHLRLLPLTADGLRGVSPADDAREVIAQAIAVQQYGARFFQNDGQSGGILEHPGHFRTNEDRKLFIDAWKRARTGSNAHRDALLEHGIKYNRLAPNNEQAQFIETRKQLAYEIAQIWRIPPHKVGLLERATNNNIEQQALEFVTDTLYPYLTLWEQAVKKDLILGSGYFAEFNVLGLLRGDVKTRYEAYATARQWGWLSVNDIRKLENMNGIGPSGDRYIEPMNMAPAGAQREDQPRGMEFRRTARGVWIPVGATFGDEHAGHA